MILFGWFLFKNKARGGSGNFEKGVGRVNMVRYGILHDHTSKKRSIEIAPLYSTFKLKYRKNVKLTIFLTLSRRRPLSYRNESIDLLCKSVDSFLHGNGLRLERVSGNERESSKITKC